MTQNLGTTPGEWTYSEYARLPGDGTATFATGHFLRPNLVVVPANARAGITDRGVEVAAALVVEVLSPSSRSIDRVKKPRDGDGRAALSEDWPVHRRR